MKKIWGDIMDKTGSRTTSTLPTIGFLGLGAMGGPMAANLLKADYSLTGFDPRAKRLKTCVTAGAMAAGNPTEVVRRSEVVLTSLPSSAVFVQVAEQYLLPHAHPNQIFMDTGTTEAAETRRLANEFNKKGTHLLDTPVSGGWQGSESGTLRIFVGGDECAYGQCRPILEVLGDPERIVYCGSSGAGQVVKGVNQLAIGLGHAAYLEALAFGVRAGVNPAVINQGVGGPEGWRGHFSSVAKRVMEATADGVNILFPELPYFLREAHEQGFDIPMTEALFAFCDAGPRDWVDNQNRPVVALWHELMNRPGKTSSQDTDP